MCSTNITGTTTFQFTFTELNKKDPFILSFNILFVVTSQVAAGSSTYFLNTAPVLYLQPSELVTLVCYPVVKSKNFKKKVFKNALHRI